MKDEDFADGIYWILHAVNYSLGGEHSISSGIDYKNDIFQTFDFWSHSECTCTYSDWEWEVDKQVGSVLSQIPGLVHESTEWWSHYHEEYTKLIGEGREHDEDCALEDVGFRHFASGLEVTWYKHVGRSTKSNKSVKSLDWFKIVVECIESVRSAVD